MAMTETPAQQQHLTHEAVAGPTASSSSTSLPTPIAALDEVHRLPIQKLETATASSDPSPPIGQTGPTPPSSPPQGAPIEPLIAALTTIQDPTESSSTHSLATSTPAQQPTPPSTLPEDVAAFPQATAERFPEIDDGVEQPWLTNTSSEPPTPPEPHVTENRTLSIHSTERELPQIPSTPSSASSILNDGVPALDPNEAAFLLESGASVSRTQELESRTDISQTRSNHERPSTAEEDEELRRVLELSRAEMTSSHHSAQSDLPELPPQSTFARQQRTPPPIPPLIDTRNQQYPNRYSSLAAADTTSSGQRPHHNSRRRSSGQGPTPSRPERRRQNSEYVLPPWQPDSEVSSCPICASAFGFFYRKHHCRKCGRVVCAPCSPHRIVIPKSFVVSPPNAIDIDTPSNSSDTVNRRHSYLGASDTGVEVRICEDCLAGQTSSGGAQRISNQIPSPSGGAGRFWQDGMSPSDGVNHSNMFTQTPANYPGGTNSNRRRTVSNVGPYSTLNPGGLVPAGGYPGAMYNYGQPHSLGRQPHGYMGGHPPYHSHPNHQQQLPGAPPFAPHPHHPVNFSFVPSAHFYPSPQPLPQQYHHGHGHNRSSSASSHYNQFAPVNQPIRGQIDTSQHPVPAFSIPDARNQLNMATQYVGVNRELQTHSAPPQPRLKETDYCPICTQVLPPPDPVTKDETAREAHIQNCLDNAFTPQTSNRRSTSGTPNIPTAISPPHAATPTNQSTSLPAETLIRSSGSGPPTRPRANTASRSAGRMVVYTATEKDTYALGNDAEADGEKAECVICFEEFEVGDQIARLECWCRYHKKCIREWFDRKGNGECPVHAMNE